MIYGLKDLLGVFHIFKNFVKIEILFYWINIENNTVC